MVTAVIVQGPRLRLGSQSFRCALGKGGVSTNKQEGDGCTPVGTFPFREVFYRADRIAKPKCHLPLRQLTPQDGWCDDPNDANYNCFVTLPYPGRHEQLWRDDHLYDLLVVIGYNDRLVNVGAGSAIFMHVAKENYAPTSGCV